MSSTDFVYPKGSTVLKNSQGFHLMNKKTMAIFIQPYPSQNPNYPPQVFGYLFRKLLIKTDIDKGLRFPEEKNIYLMSILPESIKNKSQSRFTG